MLISCYHENDYLPTNINADQVIKSFAPVDSVIAGDGQSFTYLIAELPVEADNAKSTVTFTTSKGTFDNNTKTITQPATVINDNGTNRRIAKVKLVSIAQVDTAQISATVANITKYSRVVFSNLAYDSFLTVTADHNSIPADGASFTTLTVMQPLNLLSDYNSITFTTTSGTFDNGTKTISKSSGTVLINGSYQKMAQVRLTSSKNVETANVEVAIKGTTKNIAINFTRAYPENIKISIAAPYIASGIDGSQQITINLLRSKGTPSVGTVASLSVMDTNRVSLGTFINYNNLSDASGTIVNKFTLGTDTYKGTLKILAQTADSTGQTLRDSVNIIVK